MTTKPCQRCGRECTDAEPTNPCKECVTMEDDWTPFYTPVHKEDFLLMVEKHPTWDDILKLAQHDPIVAAFIKTYPDMSREELLMLLVLELSTDRMARIAHEVETKEMEFLNSLGQIKC